MRTIATLTALALAATLAACGQSSQPAADKAKAEAAKAAEATKAPPPAVDATKAAATTPPRPLRTRPRRPPKRPRPPRPTFPRPPRTRTRPPRRSPSKPRRPKRRSRRSAEEVAPATRTRNAGLAPAFSLARPDSTSRPAAGLRHHHGLSRPQPAPEEPRCDSLLVSAAFAAAATAARRRCYDQPYAHRRARRPRRRRARKRRCRICQHRRRQHARPAPARPDCHRASTRSRCTSSSARGIFRPEYADLDLDLAALHALPHRGELREHDGWDVDAEGLSPSRSASAARSSGSRSGASSSPTRRQSRHGGHALRRGSPRLPREPARERLPLLPILLRARARQVEHRSAVARAVHVDLRVAQVRDDREVEALQEMRRDPPRCACAHPRGCRPARPPARRPSPPCTPQSVRGNVRLRPCRKPTA